MINNNNFKVDSNSNPIIQNNYEEKKIINKNILNNNNNDKNNLNKLEKLNSSTNLINNNEKKELYEEKNFKDEIIEKEKEKIEIQSNQKELKLQRELENGYKNEINDYIDNINKLKNELRLKDENLTKISQTNETLRKNLFQFSEKVNSLFNNSINQNKTIQKLNVDISKKEKLPLEEQLKMKEMQLKSTQNLLNSMIKENKSLKVKLDIFNNDETKMKILDDLKIKDDEINKLNEEKKELKFQLEEHKKCVKQFEIYKKEINNLTQMLIKSKDKYIKLKLEYDKLNSKDLNNKNNTNNINLNLSKIKKKKVEITKTPFQNEDKKKLNISKSETDLKKNNKINCFSLFSDIEKKAISTLFNNQKDLNSFNKKISIIQSFKSSNENSLRNTIKLLKNELVEKEEIIQYLLTIFKENEQMLIVSLNQNNESDITNQILKRKINEQQEIIKNLQNDNNNIKNEDLNDIKNNNISTKIKLKLKEIKYLKKDLNDDLKSFRLSSNNIMNSIDSLLPKMINSNRPNSKKNLLNDNNKHQIKLNKNTIIQK